MTTTTALTYGVPAMSCEHCRVAIGGEVGRLDGIRSVEIDLDAKVVRVLGDDVDDAAVRAAIDRAGYDTVPA